MIDKEKNFLSVVIYVYNSCNDLPEFLENIKGWLEGRFENYEIICVNDDSNDDSKRAIKKFAENIQNISVNIINMSFYQGIEAAMNAGVDLAIGDFVIEIDNMRQVPSMEYVDKAYDMALAGNDIISLAPDKVEGLFSKVFYRLYNTNIMNKCSSLNQECLRIISRRAINRAYSLTRKVGYRKAAYANCGLKRAFLYYKTLDNKKVTYSKKELNNRTELAIESFVLYTNLMQRISAIMSTCFLTITILGGVYVLGVYFSNHKPIEGWTSMMLFMAMGFTGIFFMFTIILKMVTILLKQIFERQKYLIESIEKLSNN